MNGGNVDERQRQRASKPILIEAYEHEIDIQVKSTPSFSSQKCVEGEKTLCEAQSVNTNSLRTIGDDETRAGLGTGASLIASVAALSSKLGPEEQCSSKHERCSVTGTACDSSSEKKRKTSAIQVGTSSKSKRKCIGRDTRDFTPTPVIILSNRNSSVTDHSYRDFSTCPVPNEDKKLVDYSSDNSESKEMSFGLMLHEILQKKEYNGYIKWMPHGRAFRIMIPKRLEMKVLPKYFNHSRYSTFMRQLNNHGFKHLTQGQDRNCHYHEAFLRGLPHLVKYMPRIKNRRRLLPCPEQEPNLYRISELFPLPDTAIDTGSSNPESSNAEPSQREASIKSSSSLLNFQAKHSDEDIIRKEEYFETEKSPDASNLQEISEVQSLINRPVQVAPFAQAASIQLQSEKASIGLMSLNALPETESFERRQIQAAAVRQVMCMQNEQRLQDVQNILLRQQMRQHQAEIIQQAHAIEQTQASQRAALRQSLLQPVCQDNNQLIMAEIAARIGTAERVLGFNTFFDAPESNQLSDRSATSTLFRNLNVKQPFNKHP